MSESVTQGSLSTDAIHLATVKAVAQRPLSKEPEHLDIGSGQGDLIALMRHEFQSNSHACDYTDELMALDDVRVDVANLNTQPLPYPDARFQVVTCTEVIEHLENPRELIRQIHRVLQPNGQVVITTPNVLNLKSRIRYLFFGFFNLFGPLHFKESRLYSSGGHITPISAFYLVHALVDAGFSDIRLSIDKPQSTSRFWRFWLNPLIQLVAKGIRRTEVRRYHTIDDNNLPWVLWMNSADAMLGRTVVVSACKP